MFVRRCHICGYVCESSADILKCNECQKSLLPFHYFEKRRVRETAEAIPVVDEIYRDELGLGPIRGLTVYW